MCEVEVCSSIFESFSCHIPHNYAAALQLLQLHTAQVTGHHFDALFLLFMFFQDLNFILPWLLILVSKFLLVILEIPPNFLQDIKFACPLDAVNLVCSDIDIDTLSNPIRSLPPSLQQQYVACDLRFQLFS